MNRVFLLAACVAAVLDVTAAGTRVATVVQPTSCEPASGRAGFSAVRFKTDAASPYAELAAVASPIDGAPNIVHTHGMKIALHRYFRGVAFLDVDLRGIALGAGDSCTPAQLIDAAVAALGCTAKTAGVQAIHLHMVRGWIPDQDLGRRHERVYSRDEFDGFTCS